MGENSPMLFQHGAIFKTHRAICLVFDARSFAPPDLTERSKPVDRPGCVEELYRAPPQEERIRGIMLATRIL